MERPEFKGIKYVMENVVSLPNDSDEEKDLIKI